VSITNNGGQPSCPSKSEARQISLLDSFKADPIDSPAQAVLAVFELLSKKMTRGEIEKVRHALPQELQDLWPEHYIAPGTVR